MQHNHVLKKLYFNLLAPSPKVVGDGGEGGSAGHVAAFRDSLKFEIQHDHVMKKLNFDLLTPRVSKDKGKGGRVCRQNICYHVATFCDSNKFDMQHDQIKSNQIILICIKSSHRTVTSHMYTVTQEQSQT